jgi:hypothetical protein
VIDRGPTLIPVDAPADRALRLTSDARVRRLCLSDNGQVAAILTLDDLAMRMAGNSELGRVLADSSQHVRRRSSEQRAPASRPLVSPPRAAAEPTWTGAATAEVMLGSVTANVDKEADVSTTEEARQRLDRATSRRIAAAAAFLWHLQRAESSQRMDETSRLKTEVDRADREWHASYKEWARIRERAN